MAYLDENRDHWWTEHEIDLGHNPKLSLILAKETGPLSTLSKYFPQSPSNILTQSEYSYDNDTNHYYASCDRSGGQQHAGVNLTITEVPLEDRKKIDIMIDGADTPDCGKVTYNPDDTGGGSGHRRLFFHVAPGGRHH